MRIGDEAVRDLEARMVRHLRNSQGVSRVELARRMALSPSTVSAYVDRLIDGGFIREGKKLERAAGRPPTVLALNPRSGCFVGIDFEGRQFWMTAVDFAQQPLCSRRIPIAASDSAESVLRKAEGAIAEMVAPHGPLLGLAIGVPGVLDTRTGTAVHYEYIRGWSNLPLKDRFEHRFGVPVFLENNIRIMALAEELFGHARGVRDFLCLGIRSGIGTGLVIDGRLHTGPNHLAGEIGHWPCGKRGKLEQIASIKALSEQLEELIRSGESTSLTLRQGRVQLPDLLSAARKREPLVGRVLRSAGKVIGRVLSQMTFTLNPEVIVVAGPLAELETPFLSAIRETLAALVLSPRGRVPRVVGSELGEFAGALGGAALAIRQWVPLSSQN